MDYGDQFRVHRTSVWKKSVLSLSPFLFFFRPDENIRRIWVIWLAVATAVPCLFWTEASVPLKIILMDLLKYENIAETVRETISFLLFFFDISIFPSFLLSLLLLLLVLLSRR